MLKILVLLLDINTSGHIDLGVDILDLGVDILDLGVDILDLGPVVCEEMLQQYLL